MASLNRVFLIGNLTRDPEIRYTPAGTAVGDISIACNRKWREESTGNMKEEVAYIDITLWGKQAEFAGQYLHKGRSVFVEGRLQLDTWEDKATGQKRSKIKVVAESIQGLDRAPEQGERAPRQQEQRQAPQQPARRTAVDALNDAQREPEKPDEQEEPEGDIPW